MSRVLFIQNGEYDPPGLFATVLRERGVMLDVVPAWRGEPVPSATNGWDGIAVGGGSMSAYETDQFPFLSAEEALIIAARAHGIPVFGMCLGAQLMAAALGGNVYPNTAMEIGFHEVRLTPAAERDPLWKQQATAFHPVHWHGDTFSLPPGATLLASSHLTANQLFRVDETLYGVQFHLEIDGPVLAAMVQSDDDGWLPKNGVDPGGFLREASVALPQVEPLARAVFTRWTELLA